MKKTFIFQRKKQRKKKIGTYVFDLELFFFFITGYI